MLEHSRYTPLCDLAGHLFLDAARSSATPLETTTCMLHRQTADRRLSSTLAITYMQKFRGNSHFSSSSSVSLVLFCFLHFTVRWLQTRSWWVIFGLLVCLLCICPYVHRVHCGKTNEDTAVRHRMKG